jgi:2-hydroxychromene-2-carboxylate isomerase
MGVLPVSVYFDFTCPYAYIAMTRLPQIEETLGRAVTLKPVLLGGLFHALEQPQNMSTTLSPQKAENNRKEVVRWASWYNTPINTPLRHPNRSVLALRVLLATPKDAWRKVIAAFYAVYWVESADISDAEVLSARLTTLGLDAAQILKRAGTAEIKDALREQTKAAFDLGVFGVPTIQVGDALFWGQDRVDMALSAAEGWTANAETLANFSFNQTKNEPTS